MIRPLWSLTDDNVQASVHTLYEEAQEEETTLFPLYPATFWSAYALNSDTFDRFFENKYYSFLYARSFKASTSNATILSHFKSTISSYFAINEKRLNELYRVQVLAADAYDVVNNYDLREEGTIKNTGTVTNAMGARQDSTGYGEKETEYEKGATSATDIYGSRTDSNSTTIGAQTTNSTEKRSAFNSSNMPDVAGGVINNGQRADSSSLTTGGHTDSHNTLKAIDVTTEGSHTDSFTKGAQSDTRTDNTTATIENHKYGNIGVQTPADIIGGHLTLWQNFNFYQIIFDEICAQYLSVDSAYDGMFATHAGGSGGGGDDRAVLDAIAELSEQLAAVQSSINTNVDQSETAVTGSVAAAVTTINNNTDAKAASINSNVDAAETSINSNVDAAEAAIRGDITEVLTNGY